MTFDEFIARYEGKLGEDGGITIAFASRRGHPGHPKAAADSFVQSLHMSALGERWIDPRWDIRTHLDPHVGDPEGHLTARLQLRIDSTDNRPWFTPEAARQIAGNFYGMFASDRLVRLMNMLTNRPKDGAIVSGGNPITKAPLDWAYVAMDDENIGIICMEQYF